MQNHKNNFIGSGEAQSCKLNEQHRSFLNKRGITDSIIDAFSIHSEDVPTLGLHNAIVIPVHHIDGTHSFNKYRRDPMEGPVKPKYLFERGGKVTLYGADKLVAELSNHTRKFFTAKGLTEWDKDTLKEAKYEPLKAIPAGSDEALKPVTVQEIVHKPVVIITEGELDTLVCWSAGIPAVSSTAGATSFQEEWVELLDGRAAGEADALPRYETYICFDNDEAGHKGAIKVLESLPNARVIIVPNQLEVKDISDYVARGGDIHKLLLTAFTVTDIEDAKVQFENLSGAWRLNEAKFFEMYIEHHKTPALPSNVNGAAKPTSQSDDRLERAKSVDCTTLYEFARKGRYPVAKCLWHDDHDPSLTYYARNNSCYCHVCGKYADAVDIVMVRDGVTFKEALKTLLND